MAEKAMPGSTPTGAVVGAAATLAATLLGGGGALVPIMLAVRETGYVLAPLLFVGGAAWTLYTSWLLLRASELSGERSYEAIAATTLGQCMSCTVQVVIILNAFLLCVSVQGLYVDLIGLEVISRAMSVAISGVVVFPLTALLRRVDRLAFLSYVTAGTAIVFLGFVIARTQTGPGKFPSSDLSPFASGDEPAVIWIEALATIVIGYVVQFNVLPIYFSLPTEGAKTGMMRALYWGMGLTFVVYVTTLLLSYLTFGIESYDAILAAYTAMPAGVFATVQLGIGQLLSYPIIAHAAVTEVGKMVLPCVAPFMEPATSTTAGSKTENTSLLVDKATAGASSKAERVAEGIAGCLWVALSTVLACILVDVSSLLSVVGALCATPLMTVFPPMMLLRCAGAEAEPLRPLHAFMAVLGILATVAGGMIAFNDYGIEVNEDGSKHHILRSGGWLQWLKFSSADELTVVHPVPALGTLSDLGI